MSRLFPSTDRKEDVDVQGNPQDRVFRVTDRTIDTRTRLIIAVDPEGAVADDATQITILGRGMSHEVTECVELVPTTQAYHSPPEKTL